MADNNTYFINTEIALDSKQAMQKIRKLDTECERLEKTLNKDQELRINIVSDIENVEKRIQQLKEDTADIRESKKYNLNEFGMADKEANAAADVQIEKNNKALAKAEAEQEKLNKKLRDYDTKLRLAGDQIENNKTQMQELNGYVQQANDNATRSGGKDGNVLSARQAKHTASGIEKLGKRIAGLAKRVFVFSMITMGLRAVRKWLGEILQQDAEANKAMSQLRGALLTLIQPLVATVVPVVTKLLHILTQIILYIAQFVNGLFGQSLATAAENAQALYKNTHKANKEMGQLAKFDELNTISNGNGDSAESNAPSFDFSDYDTDNSKIAAAAKVRDIIIDIYNWCNEHLKPIWDYFVQVIVPALLDGIGIIWDDLKDISAIGFEDAQRILGDLWNIVVDIADLIASIWDDTIDPETVLKNLAKDIAKFLLNSLRGLIKLFIGLIKTIVDAMVWLLNQIPGVKVATPKAFDQGLKDIDELFDGLVQGVDDWWSEDKKATADMSGRAKKLALEQIRQSENTVVALTDNTGKISDSFVDAGLRVVKSTDGTLGKVEASYDKSTRSIYNAVKGSNIPQAYEITARQALADYMNGVDWQNGGRISSRDIARAFINAGVPAEYAMTGAEACVSYFSQSWGQNATRTADEITTTTARGLRNGKANVNNAINDMLTANPTEAARRTADAYSHSLASYLSKKTYKLEAGAPSTTPDGRIIIRYNALPMANGGVIPANKPFLALLGDQTSGTNIEAPLSTIQEAVANVINSGTMADLLRQLIREVHNKDLNIGKSAALGRVAQQSIEMYQRVSG